ncbi:MAG: transcriptional regulator [Gemmiger sp.]
MHPLEVAFTPEDRLILNSYSQMLDGLAQYLGPGYELVLHSLEDLEHSAIRVINGAHTGRKEGAPITELALTMLGRIHDQAQGDCICYSSANKDGKPLRSTTIAIRGKGSRIIGLLCINFYLDTPLSTLLACYLPQQNQPAAETYVQNSTEMVQSAVERAAAETDAAGFAASPLRNREIVSRLYGSGIFNIKDAVVLVADCLGISKNTVYLHLRHCKESEVRPT